MVDWPVDLTAALVGPLEAGFPDELAVETAVEEGGLYTGKGITGIGGSIFAIISRVRSTQASIPFVPPIEALGLPAETRPRRFFVAFSS